jgi:hypothetical protein
MITGPTAGVNEEVLPFPVAFEFPGVRLYETKPACILPFDNFAEADGI